MKTVVTFIRRRDETVVTEREDELTEAIIRIGRGTGNEIRLPDPGVRLEHARICHRGEVSIIEAVGSADLVVEERIEQPVTLSLGARVRIGPYELVVTELDKDGLALTVENVQPLGNTLRRLQSRSRTSLDQTWISTRAFAWILVMAILVGLLVWPAWETGWLDQVAPWVAKGPRPAEREMTWVTAPDMMWLSGELSNPHKSFGNDCKSCHKKPFEPVADAACTACHQNISHHADPRRVSLPELSDRPCQACHKEHRGPLPITRNDQAFCVGCHRDLGQKVAGTGLLDAADFRLKKGHPECSKEGRPACSKEGHPEFRPAVVADAANRSRHRLSLDPATRPVERSNLKFPHDKHMPRDAEGRPMGLRFPGRKAEAHHLLECKSCHAIENGGIGMQPIEMERHCQDCHPLTIVEGTRTVTLPHGEFARAIETIDNFYGNLALRGGVSDPMAPAEAQERRGSGGEVSAKERSVLIKWVDDLIKGAKEFTFLRKARCGECHVIRRVAREPGAGQADWRIDSVYLADRWMLKGKFNHRAHETTSCTHCHSAPASKEAGDVLLPGLATCVGCHGGEQASDKLPSTCVMCHDFHVAGHGLMRPRAASAADGS